MMCDRAQSPNPSSTSSGDQRRQAILERTGRRARILRWLLGAATYIILGCLGGAFAAAQSTRDLAGEFDLADSLDLGETVSTRLALRVANFSGVDRTGFSIVVVDDFSDPLPFARFEFLSLVDGEAIRLTAWVTVPKAVYESWMAGGSPRVLALSRDGGEIQQICPVRVVRGLVEFED